MGKSLHWPDHKILNFFRILTNNLITYTILISIAIHWPLTFNAYDPGVIVFIPKPESVIICLSLPFILYVIVPAFAPGVGSPPLSILIKTSLFTPELELPNVFVSIAEFAPFFHILLYTFINGWELSPPLVITLAFNEKNELKLLFVKDVPGVLHQKFVELLLNVVIPDKFNDDKHAVEWFNIVVPDM